MKETSAQIIKRILNESRLQRGRPSNTIQESNDFEPGLHIINQLRKEPVHNVNVVMFKNGYKAAVPAQIRDKALMVFESLKPAQKQAYQNLIEESPESFMKALHLTENDLVLSDGPVDGSNVVSEEKFPENNLEHPAYKGVLERHGWKKEGYAGMGVIYNHPSHPGHAIESAEDAAWVHHEEQNPSDPRRHRSIEHGLGDSPKDLEAHLNRFHRKGIINESTINVPTPLLKTHHLKDGSKVHVLERGNLYHAVIHPEHAQLIRAVHRNSEYPGSRHFKDEQGHEWRVVPNRTENTVELHGTGAHQGHRFRLTPEQLKAITE